MSKTNTQDIIETQTGIAIADIPALLALETTEQWKTIRHTQLIERLTEFRILVEAEAGLHLTAIETNLGLALADVTEWLGIKEPDTLLQVLGDEAYLQAYVDPIPYELTEQERTKQEHRAAPRLLTKLQEIEKWITAKREAKAKAKLKAEPCQIS